MKTDANIENQQAEPSVRELIDAGPMTFGIVTVIAICFILNMIDGYDVVAMSAVAPVLQGEWGISALEIGYILTAALLGMALGASFLAPLCDKFGRRPMILLSCVLSGVSLILTGMIENSLVLMLLARFGTGLGIGVIMASVPAMAAEYAPEKWRNFIVPAVVAGYPIGAIILGPIANAVIPAYGWRMLFLGEGFLTFAFVLAMYFFLPESLTFMASRKDRPEFWLTRINTSLRRIKRPTIARMPHTSTSAPLANRTSIFAPKYRVNTVKLLASFFVGFLAMYFLLTWIPSLYENNGFSRREGIAALTLLNIGGVIGIFSIGAITTRTLLTVPIGGFYFLASAALLFIFITRPTNLLVLNMLILFIGFTLQGAFTGMYTVLSRVYAVTERATGIGFSFGLGRAGAILSPILTGFLVSIGWTMYPLFAVIAIPVLIAAILVLTIKV